MTRCHCGCAEATHEHYRRGKDCGRCGRAFCPRYVPRDRAMPETHRLVASMSDAHAMHNLAALLPFGVDTFPPPPLPIPEQREPADPPADPPRRQSFTAAYREACRNGRRKQH